MYSLYVRISLLYNHFSLHPSLWKGGNHHESGWFTQYPSENETHDVSDGFSCPEKVMSDVFRKNSSSL